MAKIVNVAEAKAHLSKLIERAASGEEIILGRAGRPRAKLVPLGPDPLMRRYDVALVGIDENVSTALDGPTPQAARCPGHWSWVQPIDMQHGLVTGTERDPDLGLALAKPMTRASLACKIARDLFGATGIRNAIGLLLIDAEVLAYRPSFAASPRRPSSLRRT